MSDYLEDDYLMEDYLAGALVFDPNGEGSTVGAHIRAGTDGDLIASKTISDTLAAITVTSASDSVGITALSALSLRFANTAAAIQRLLNHDFSSGDLTSWVSTANDPGANTPVLHTFSPSSGSYEDY